jgi:hypothetical protein
MTTPTTQSTIRWKWRSRSLPRVRSHRSSVCTRSDDAADAAASSATVRNSGMSTVPASPLGAVTVSGISISTPIHARNPNTAKAISDEP